MNRGGSGTHTPLISGGVGGGRSRKIHLNQSGSHAQPEDDHAARMGGSIFDWLRPSHVLLQIYRWLIIFTNLVKFMIHCPLIYARLFVRKVIPRQRNRISGRIALVSGAGAGIGEEICYQLNELGVILVCVDVDGEAARRTAAAINRGDRHSGVPKGTAFAFECDVSDKEQVEQLARRVVEQVGDVNILFNNAGVRRVRPFLQHTNLQIEKVINTNLYGQVWMLRAFLPRLLAGCRPGSVVSMCGVAGYGGFPNMLPFVASKFAVRGLMEGLYLELRVRRPDHRLHLMTVAPFVVNTGMVQGSVITVPGLVNIVGVEEAAAAIIDNMLREEVVVFIPGIYYYIMNFLRILPLKIQLLLTDFIDTGVAVGYDLTDN